MKHGFMLIELIIATLIASMVAGILLTALAQGMRFQTAVDNIVDTSLRIGIVSNQLEKDLMGAFVPVQASSATIDEEEDQDEDASAVDNKQVDNKKPDDKKSGAKEKQKPLEKIFYATHKEGNLDTLTFITNNPLVVFVGKDVGIVKPKIVRVQYTLKPEADNPKSYILYRQESNELDLAEYKNVRAYEVIGGIKSLSIDYTARIEKKPSSAKATADKQETGKAAEGQQKEKKVEYEYKTSKDWVSERKKEGEKTQEQEFPRIPYNVEIKMALWDKQDNHDKEFTVCCEIPVDSVPEKKPEKPKKGNQPPKLDEIDQSNIKESPRKNEQQLAFNSQTRQPEVIPIDSIESLMKMLGNLGKTAS